MRKLLTRILVFLLAVTSVFGLTGLKSVKADNVAVEGIEIIGASVRNNNANENDLTGIRFTTTVSQKAYDAIITEAGENEVKFGTEITDNDVGLKIQDFCYVSTVAGGEGITQVVNGAFTYYASITFNDVDFAKDVLKKLRGLAETAEVDLATATAEETAKINAYKALAYAELLKATSYYEIDGTKYYTKSLVRSMRMVANYYDKNQEEFGKLPEEFYAKNYFVAGVERFGYLKENGEVVADNVKVDAITGVSYKAQPVEFEVVDGALKVKDTAFVEEELSETLALYAFDKDNRVTVLNLKYVTDTISTKEDLSKFDVGYTYDQAEFDALDSVAKKVAYLENCQANPYDYYEGYYVLTNDIDATDWKEVHNAVFATPTSGNIGFTVDETNNKYVPANTNATITYEGVDYNFPRPGYPVRSASAGTPNYSYFSKVGFRGVFDGQGYTISNLSFAGRAGSATNGRYTYYTDDTLNYATSLNTMGAGIFGVLASPAEVKNVAIDNAYVDFGAVFAVLLMSPGSAAWTAPDIYKQVRIQFENIYIRTRNAREWGIITYKLNGVGPTYVDCFFDFTTIGSGGNNDFKGTTIVGHGQVSQTNTGLQSRAVNMYMVVRNTKLNGTTAEHGMSGAASNVNFDLTLAESLDELYSATANIHGVEETMAQAFADNPYFTVAGNKVYWKGVYEKSLTLSNTSVELADKNATANVTLSVGGETVTPEKVDYDDTILKYEGTTLSINNYVAGTYEVVFTYNGAKTVLTVTLPAIVKDAYLQVDGELVSHGLDSIVGKYFTVNGTEVDATMFNGKIKLDIASLNLTAPTTKALSATVEMYGDYGKEITFNCEYVTLAIDEGEDLKYFNVGYTFDQAEYNALSSDVARHEYLAKCQAQPFDYYDGYYVLVKDVDASGVVFEHEAVIAPTITDAGFTYTANSSATSAVTSNIAALTGAITIPAAGDYAETTYNVPRAGYPVTNGLMNNAFDVKVGFNGIFEGNGHIITNLNDVVRTPIKYIKADSSEGTTYDVGAGLFGVLKPKAQIKNVAFVNVNVSKSGGLAMYASARSGWTSADATISPNGKRPTLQNVFIKTAPSAVNYGVVASKNDGVSSMRMRFVVIDATSHTSLAPSASKLTGGINGGERSSNNGGLNADARYTYISASAHELYYGYGNTADSKVWNRKAGTAPTTAPSTYVKADFPLNYKDLCASIDWAGTVDTADDISMYKAFTESITENSWTNPYNFSEYWEEINGMVFFKGTYGYYATPSVESVEITDAEQTFEVGLKDIDGNAITEGVEVKVNGDALVYSDGVLSVKNYIAGEYELTFIYKGAEIVVPVVLVPQQKTAYLQANGELVGSGLETIDGKSFKVNDTAVDATIVDGKIMLDIDELGLTAPIYTAGTAEVELVGAYGTEIVYTSMYVAVAIDEATDLQQFGVNYTYNQAEFDALTSNKEKKAYLEDKQANPYTYFEGYVVLTKDIDATGITFNHDAMYYVENSNTDIGYTINEVGNTLTAVNTNAPIVFNEVTYNIPRPGYPAFKAVSSSNKNSDYIPGAFFYKTGFYGTFDGQGYVIDNLNPVNSANIEYYVGETATKFSGYGAGIFGAVSANSTFKNVAFTNYVGKSGPAIALIDITPTSKGTASYNYDENDVFEAMGKSTRTKFTNMYFEIIGDDHASGSTVRFNAGNRGSDFDNIVVDATHGGWGDGVYGTSREAAYLGGGYQWSTTNGGLCQQVDNVVVITTYEPSHATSTYTHIDIIMASTAEEAFSATTNTIGETVTAPSVRFDGLDYFTVVDGIVYWHSLAPSA